MAQLLFNGLRSLLETLVKTAGAIVTCHETPGHFLLLPIQLLQTSLGAFLFLSLFFFCGSGDKIQGLMHTNNAHLRTPSDFLTYFELHIEYKYMACFYLCHVIISSKERKYFYQSKNSVLYAASPRKTLFY